MGYFRPERLPQVESDVAEARRDARVVLLIARARLGAGHPVDAAMLTALAEDERLTARLRVRAAEYLAKAYIAELQAMVARVADGQVPRRSA